MSLRSVCLYDPELTDNRACETNVRGKPTILLKYNDLVHFISACDGKRSFSVSCRIFARNGKYNFVRRDAYGAQISIRESSDANVKGKIHISCDDVSNGWDLVIDSSVNEFYEISIRNDVTSFKNMITYASHIDKVSSFNTISKIISKSIGWLIISRIATNITCELIHGGESYLSNDDAQCMLKDARDRYTAYEHDEKGVALLSAFFLMTRDRCSISAKRASKQQ